ncbi:TPA: hypothetical protein JTP90_004134 [Escherichia coli]|nr:hypothetical protein [Escherichia coli]ELY0355241.1 hypothetical protein [Escherichia coli]PGG39742.1 hypothetical protein BMR13_29570 [Escherichia coli]HAN7618923.1 hypothetical protein [Escherichia coli]HAO9376799.1 hypothetical protein [Escherichia coli]
MSVNSNGSDNRIAGRDYNENKIKIERYDGRHTVNIAIPSNNDDNARPLLKSQRKSLVIGLYLQAEISKVNSE